MSYREDSLHARLLAGDEAALRKVRGWVADSLAVSRYSRLKDEWKDLQQEVLCSIFESLREERFHGDGELKRYVWGICRHTALNRIAHRARRHESSSDLVPETVPSGANAEVKLISDQLVRRALDESSDECRKMIRAYFLEGLTYPELASRFGLPLGTAKSRLFRCLQSLRRSMAAAVRPGLPPRRVDE